MAEEKSAILPIKIKRVTDEDKEAARSELMPYYGKKVFAIIKESFAQKRKLTTLQVDGIVLELRHKASLAASSEE